MQAILLAGGKGTRLRPYTHVLPKPLMPLGDADPMPIIEVVLRQLGRFGFHDVTIITGYLTELIEAFCGDGRKFGTRLSYRRETAAAGDRRRPDAARAPERAGARDQRRHLDDARLRRDVRLSSQPHRGRHDRFVSPRGEDRFRRAALRRRSARLDRISGKAGVFVRGEHGGLHPRSARLGLPDAGPAACPCPTSWNRCATPVTIFIATARNATGSISAATTITPRPTRSSNRAAVHFWATPQSRTSRSGATSEYAPT